MWWRTHQMKYCWKEICICVYELLFRTFFATQKNHPSVLLLLQLLLVCCTPQPLLDFYNKYHCSICPLRILSNIYIRLVCARVWLNHFQCVVRYTATVKKQYKFHRVNSFGPQVNRVWICALYGVILINHLKNQRCVQFKIKELMRISHINSIKTHSPAVNMPTKNEWSTVFAEYEVLVCIYALDVCIFTYLNIYLYLHIVEHMCKIYAKVFVTQTQMRVTQDEWAICHFLWHFSAQSIQANLCEVYQRDVLCIHIS